MILYSIILLLLFNLGNKTFRTPAIALSIFLALVMVALSIATSRSFNMVIMDVGQGDAAFLLTPQRKSIIIDTGPASQHSSAARSAVLPVLNYFNTSTVNRLFISHPHLDHMGGTFDLLKYIHVDSVYLPPTSISYKWNDSLMHVLDKKLIPHRVLQMGDRVIIDQETRAYVLGPGPELTNITAPSGQNLNNSSLVLLIRFRQQTLLFPGDAEKEAENFLVLWENLLKSDFLKVGHHGSKTSTTDPFFSLVHPRYASISVGEGNHFGHPSEDVIRRLRNNGSEVFRTDKDRAIWLQIQNGNWREINWQ
jgi:competence protein ComEC